VWWWEAYLCHAGGGWFGHGVSVGSAFSRGLALCLLCRMWFLRSLIGSAHEGDGWVSLCRIADVVHGAVRARVWWFFLSFYVEVGAFLLGLGVIYFCF